MRKLLTTALVFASMTAATNAFAQTENSEFFWQAEEGRTYIIPALSLVNGEVKRGATTLDISSTTLGAGIEHGLTTNVSLHGQLSYSSGKKKSGVNSMDLNGLNDVLVGAKVTRALGNGNVKYGAIANLSLEKQEFEANGDSNSATGQHYVAPYLGYEFSVNTMKLGAKASYEINIGDRKATVAGTDDNSSGGEALAAELFAENNYGSHTFGVNLAYISYTDRKYDDGTVSEGDNDWGARLYSNFKLNDTTDLGAHLAYLNLDDKDLTGSVLNALVQLRIAL